MRNVFGKGKKLKLILSVIIILILIAVIAVGCIFRTELNVLKNVIKVDDYGFYTMNYDMNYDLYELLFTGASTDQEYIDYIIKKIFKGIPISINISNYACSTFNGVSSNEEYILGRNFDWGYSPSMLVWTDPEVGYSSISMVNLGFLVYDDTYLPDNYFNRLLTLAAPYVPLDGMNEKGLAIGVLQLMDDATNQNTDKVDLTTTAMIRLVLDRAATVEEAIALFNSYDMHDSVGSCYHYQIIDATGASVIIEYVDNVLNLIYPEHNELNIQDFQMAANFYITEGVDDPKGFGQDRYQIIEDTLAETGGLINQSEAMDLLEAARITSYVWEDGWEDKTQWSIVYDVTNLKVDICVGMNYDKVYSYSLSAPPIN